MDCTIFGDVLWTIQTSPVTGPFMTDGSLGHGLLAALCQGATTMIQRSRQTRLPFRVDFHWISSLMAIIRSHVKLPEDTL